MSFAGFFIPIILASLVCIGGFFFIINLIKEKYVSAWLKSILIFLQITIFVIYVIILSGFLKYRYDSDIKHAYYHGISIKREVHFDNQNNIEKVDTTFYVNYN